MYIYLLVIEMEGRKRTQQKEYHQETSAEEHIITVSQKTTPMVQEEETMGGEVHSKDEDDEFDFDDVLVFPAEGMLIKQNEDEVRLLFFYVKPTMDDTITYKAVTELRIPQKRFPGILDEIQHIIKKGSNIMQTESPFPMYS